MTNYLIFQSTLSLIVRSQSGRPEMDRVKSRNEDLESNITSSICQQLGTIDMDAQRDLSLLIFLLTYFLFFI